MSQKTKSAKRNVSRKQEAAGLPTGAKGKPSKSAKALGPETIPLVLEGDLL